MAPCSRAPHISHHPTVACDEGNPIAAVQAEGKLTQGSAWKLQHGPSKSKVLSSFEIRQSLASPLP